MWVKGHFFLELGQHNQQHLRLVKSFSGQSQRQHFPFCICALFTLLGHYPVSPEPAWILTQTRIGGQRLALSVSLLSVLFQLPSQSFDGSFPISLVQSSAQSEHVWSCKSLLSDSEFTAMDFLKVVNIIWSINGQIFTLGVKGCAARYLPSTSGTVFLLVGNMPTVKYILKKTVGFLEREIKYCTYWKTSARIPIKVKLEKMKHNRKDLMTVFTLSLHLCCHTCSGAWPWPHCSQHWHRPWTHMISVTNSVLLTQGPSTPSCSGSSPGTRARCFPVQEEEECRGRCLLLSTILSWFRCYSLTTWLSAMIPDSLCLLGEFLDRDLQNQI